MAGAWPSEDSCPISDQLHGQKLPLCSRLLIWGRGSSHHLAQPLISEWEEHSPEGEGSFQVTQDMDGGAGIRGPGFVFRTYPVDCGPSTHTDPEMHFLDTQF